MVYPSKLIIVGAGGAAVEALWVFRRGKWTGAGGGTEVIGFADDNPARKGEILEGLPIIGTTLEVAENFGNQGVGYHCAIGTNSARRRICELLDGRGLVAVSLIDSTAIVSPSAMIGDGSYVAPLAFVGPAATVGRHVMINVGASVGHHAVVGEYAQLCPGARLSGKSSLGPEAFLGSNAVVSPGVSLGQAAVLGAGSFAARDVPDRSTAVGNPAKVLAVPPRAP